MPKASIIFWVIFTEKFVKIMMYSEQSKNLLSYEIYLKS